MSTVICGLSGGVDSSVAAYLLQQEGYQVKGVFMQNWEGEDEFCTIKTDSLDACAVSDILGIDIEIINFSQEYKKKVFQYFLTEYQAGRTPNPDILCNSEIKFKAFLNYALNNGANYIATGHYVNKVLADDGLQYLAKADDLNKDQSYFLYRLNQNQIKPSLFPLAKLNKTKVRKIASQLKLPTADKKDSTGICFIGERPFRQFLSQYMPKTPGEIIDCNGKILGKHEGLMYYTLGQRKGLGIGGAGDPWFVYAKDLKKNQLLVVQGHDNHLLYQKNLEANQLSFISGIRPRAGIYKAKTRYRMQDAECYLDYIDENIMKLEFTLPQFAVTPGQSVVIYQGDVMLGGGIII